MCRTFLPFDVTHIYILLGSSKNCQIALSMYSLWFITALQANSDFTLFCLTGSLSGWTQLTPGSRIKYIWENHPFGTPGSTGHKHKKGFIWNCTKSERRTETIHETKKESSMCSFWRGNKTTSGIFLSASHKLLRPNTVNVRRQVVLTDKAKNTTHYMSVFYTLCYGPFKMAVFCAGTFEYVPIPYSCAARHTLQPMYPILTFSFLQRNWFFTSLPIYVLIIFRFSSRKPTK